MHDKEATKSFQKSFTVFGAVALLALFASTGIHAQANQSVIPGTQVRVTLSNGLSTTVAHNGDPFEAVVAEPVFLGNQIILPAGAKVHGTSAACSARSGSRCSAAALR